MFPLFAGFHCFGGLVAWFFGVFLHRYILVNMARMAVLAQLFSEIEIKGTPHSQFILIKHTD